MDRFLKDFGFAIRAIRAHKAFAVTAIITLALGIGVSTAIFSVVNAVLLRPLPYKDADRLVFVWGDLRNRKVFDFAFAPADYRDLQQQGTLFEEFGAVVPGQAPLTGDGAQPEQVKTTGVTANLLSMLGARVMYGRPFVPEDALPQPQPPQGAGAAPGAQQPPAQRLPGIAILNYGFWQRRYGSDSSIVGKTIDLGGGAVQVVGVLAPGFELLFPPGNSVEPSPDVLIALRVDFANESPAARINVFLRVFGKLKRGVPLSRAQDQVERLAADLRERFPIKKTAGLHFRLERVADDVVADVRPAILALMGAVIFVLLIACANVANLLLVRASARERELAVRAALGSSPWRLVRQMLAESLVLAGSGVVVGLALAWAGIRLLVRIAPASLPRLDGVAIDPLVLAFAVVAALVSVALFGVLPAVRASRPDVADVLRAGRTPSLAGGKLLRNAVVTIEVALSFVLLIGSGLMVRSFAALSRVDPGYDPRGILTLSVNDPGAGRTPEERATFPRLLAERLRALPGVTSVTAANPLPLDGGIGNARWGTEEAVADNSKFQQANTHIVLPGYFETMRTRVIAGHAFTEDDNRPQSTSIIIDNLLAAKAFPNTAPQSVVGRRLLARIRSNDPEWLTVVAVVQHERHETLSSDGREAIFVTDGFVGHGAASRWAVRVACRAGAACDPSAISGAARAAIAQLAPLAAVAEVQPMTAFVDRAMASTRFALVLIGIFAFIAAVLASVGLYGVLSTVVRQRTAEIGVRMAFGAENRAIFQMMIGQGLRLSAIGIAAGLVVAVLLTRVMGTMLVGVKPTDPLTFGAIAALFICIAALASWLPARRAAALDPTVALREE